MNTTAASHQTTHMDSGHIRGKLGGGGDHHHHHKQ